MACRRSPDSLAMRCCAAASSLAMRVAAYASRPLRGMPRCRSMRSLGPGRFSMASRRKFLQAAAGGVLMAQAAQPAKQAGGAPSGSVPKGKYKVPAGARVPTRKLGKTGVDVSIVGLGGYHLGIPPEEEAIRIVRTALDHGMNFL